uniref:Uncharacterized protein n=1 Tax=Rhizobium rhizogenes TaxID=359 RepID=Q9F5F6_RHIRH|nr:hypothetical protein [Rhizobium rhizogenes]
METKPPPVRPAAGVDRMRREEWLFGRNAVGSFVLVGSTVFRRRRRRAVPGLGIVRGEVGRIAGGAAVGELAFKTIRRFFGGDGVLLFDDLALLDQSGNILRVWREQGCRMDEVPLLEVFDECCARLTDLWTRENRRILAGRLKCLPRQAKQEILRAHIREIAIRADGLAGDTRNNTAVRHTAAARKHIDQRRTRSNPQCVDVEGQLAAAVEQPNRMASEPLRTEDGVVCTRVDPDVQTGKGEHEERRQRVVLNRCASERLVQRVRSEVTDDVVALLRDIRTLLRRVDHVVASGGTTSNDGSFARGLLLLRHPVVDGLNLAVPIQVHGGVVALVWLAIDAARLLRQLCVAPLRDLDDHALLGQIVGHPLLLGAEIGFDIGGVAAVLVGRGKQILDPFDAVGFPEIVAEARILGIHAGLAQRVGDLEPHGRLALLRLLRLPDLLLLIEVCGRDRSKLLLVRHVAERHLIEHGGQDVGEQPQLANLPDGQGKCDGNCFLGPVESDQAFDPAPLVDRVQRFACDVLDHGPHGAIVVGGFDDENLDFFEPRGDRHAGAPMAGFDDVAIPATDLGKDDRRLDDADGFYRGEQQGIGLWRGFGLAGVVRVVLQRSRIDLHDVHGIFLFRDAGRGSLAGPSCLHFFRRHLPDRRAGGPAQRRPSVPAAKDKRG